MTLLHHIFPDSVENNFQTTIDSISSLILYVVKKNFALVTILSLTF